VDKQVCVREPVVRFVHDGDSCQRRILHEIDPAGLVLGKAG
jgi:hypothetical protein